jgi:chaperonin cofactor prefoldin
MICVLLCYVILAGTDGQLLLMISDTNSFIPIHICIYSASYAGLQQWQEAAADAKKCIQLDPTFMKGYYRLATAQIELEEYDGAQATVKQGLTLDANNTPLLKVLKSIKLKKKAAANDSNQKQQQQQQQIGGPGGDSKMDSAASKEMHDLQVLHAQMSREYNTVQANLHKSQRAFKMHGITRQELEASPSEGDYFRSIGKIFIKSNKDQVMDHLKSNMDENEKQEVDMTQKLEYLERRIKSQQQNIQELAVSLSSAAE